MPLPSSDELLNYVQRVTLRGQDCSVRLVKIFRVLYEAGKLIAVIK